MIVARVPHRVSFAGGGTDLPAYCDQSPGLVVSCAIQSYVTVELEAHDGFAVSSHPRLKAACEFLGCPNIFWTRVTSDVPPGSGLGGSSALTVAILAALHAYRGDDLGLHPRVMLAEEACRVEIDVLKAPIGRQDQYACSLGGVNRFSFHCHGIVGVESLRDVWQVHDELERHCLLLRVGGQRDADEILRTQVAEVPQRSMTLECMRDVAWHIADAIYSPDFRRCGGLVHDGWMFKRRAGSLISNSDIDRQYFAALSAGAWGGKLCGAGGSGYLFLVGPPGRHEVIREALGRPSELPFKIDWKGCQVETVPDRSLETIYPMADAVA